MTSAPLAAVALLAILAAVALFAWRIARRTGLGIAHPAVAWLALEGVFFGIGSLVLAVRDGREGPAAYLGGAVLAFGIGLAAADVLAGRRAPMVADPVVTTVRGPVAGAGATRWAVVGALAAGAVLLLVPTLLRTGLPFLTADVTGSRVEISGLIVQPLRVALPGLAVLALLAARGGSGPEDRRRRLVALAVVGSMALFDLLLASRYLLAELAGVLALAWLIAGHRIPVRVAALAAGVGFVLFTSVGLVRVLDQAEGRPLEFIAGRTVNRVVLIQPRTLDALMTVIPAEEPHFGGLTWLRRLGPLLGRDDIPNIGYWIYPRVVAEPQAVAGYAAPGLIGEAWANFGWAGLALFAGLGVVAERLGRLLAGRRASPVDAAAGALAVLFLARTHALGLLGVAVLGVLVVAWRLAAAPLGGLVREVRQVATWRR